MNGLCWVAGCSIRGLLPAGAEARCSSTERCDSRGSSCWEGKCSSWVGGLARGPSWPRLYHTEEPQQDRGAPLIYNAVREDRVIIHTRKPR